MKTITSADFAHLINAFSGDVVAETLTGHKWLTLPSAVLKEATCRAAENLIDVTLAQRNFYVVGGHDICRIEQVHGNGLVEIHDCFHDAYVATYPLVEFQSRYKNVFVEDANHVISIRKLLSHQPLDFNSRHIWHSGNLLEVIESAKNRRGITDGVWISVLFRIELPRSGPDYRYYYFKMDSQIFSTVYPEVTRITENGMFDNEGAEFIKQFNLSDHPEVVMVSAKRLIITTQVTIKGYQEDANSND